MRSKEETCARLTVRVAVEPTKNFLDHYLEELKEQLGSQRK